MHDESVCSICFPVCSPEEKAKQEWEAMQEKPGPAKEWTRDTRWTGCDPPCLEGCMRCYDARVPTYVLKSHGTVTRSTIEPKAFELKVHVERPEWAGVIVDAVEGAIQKAREQLSIGEAVKRALKKPPGSEPVITLVGNEVNPEPQTFMAMELGALTADETALIRKAVAERDGFVFGSGPSAPSMARRDTVCSYCGLTYGMHPEVNAGWYPTGWGLRWQTDMALCDGSQVRVIRSSDEDDVCDEDRRAIRGSTTTES